jgi:hypothetical protein
MHPDQIGTILITDWQRTLPTRSPMSDTVVTTNLNPHPHPHIAAASVCVAKLAAQLIVLTECLNRLCAVQ